MIALGDDIQRLLITRRDEGTARLALVEKVLFGHLVGLGMVCDEDDFHVAVARRNELIEQEEETPRQILLHRIHRTGRIHHADYDRIRIFAGVELDMLIAQIVLMKRKPPKLLFPDWRFGLLSRRLDRRSRQPILARRQHSHHALAGGAPLIETHTNSDVTVTLTLA